MSTALSPFIPCLSHPVSSTMLFPSIHRTTRWLSVVMLFVLSATALPSIVSAGSASVTVTFPNTSYPTVGELLELSITYNDTADPNGLFDYPLGHVIAAMTGTRTIWQATEAEPTTYTQLSVANVLGVVPLLNPLYYVYNATLNTVVPYVGPIPAAGVPYGSLVPYAYYNGTNFTAVDGFPLFPVYFILYNQFYYPTGVADFMDAYGWMIWLDIEQPGNLNVSSYPGYEQYEFCFNLFASQGVASGYGDLTDVQPYPPNYPQLFPLGEGGGFDGVIVATASGAGVLGDPQFIGLRGQSYQVHGIDGAVYNLISDVQVMVNARFTFLDHGRCMHAANDSQPLFTCWSHPGSYLGELAVRTAGGDSVVIVAGAAETGFGSVHINGEALLTGDSMPLRAAAAGLQPLTVTRPTIRTVTIAHAGLYTLTVENSDGFVNILALHVDHFHTLVTDVQPHGLLGQTWRSDQKGQEVKAVEGHIDDYVVSEASLLGCNFVYNKFNC